MNNVSILTRTAIGFWAGRLVLGSIGLYWVLSPPACAEISFPAHADYSAGVRPATVVSADLDRDGDLDLAVANAFSSNVSVFVNTGSGTFAPAVAYGVGALPSQIVAADFDRDGDIDLATSNVNSSDVSVLRNNGNATFGPAAAFKVGSPLPGVTRPFSMASADLNGDGVSDLAVANINFNNPADNTVTVLLNNRRGSFTRGIDVILNQTGPHYLSAGDLNQDGRADLVVSNRDSSSISILLNAGLGAFSLSQSIPAVDAPNSVKLADFDRDGDLDMVTANFFGSVALINNSSLPGGNLNFDFPVVYHTGGNPSVAVPVDIDNDGSLDLAIANGSFLEPADKPVFVLPNAGDGTFSLSGMAQLGSVGRDAQDIGSGDLDSDGDVDLIYTDPIPGFVSVVLNETSIARFGGSVAGLAPRQIVCSNLTTGARVVIANPLRAWDCKAAGLIVSPGDRVRFTITGIAN
jgi:hypothetical protein